jgi:hypothetical protein
MSRASAGFVWGVVAVLLVSSSMVTFSCMDDGRARNEQEAIARKLERTFGPELAEVKVSTNPHAVIVGLGVPHWKGGDYDWETSSWVIYAEPVYGIEVRVVQRGGEYVVRWKRTGGYKWGYFF